MIVYTVKFIICSGLFYLAFHFLLENEKLNKFKRFFLLFSLILSMIVPFIQFDFLSKSVLAIEMVNNSVDQTIGRIDQIIIPTHIIVPQNEIIEQEVVPEKASNNINPLWIFIALVSFVTLCLLIRFFSNLIKIIQSSQKYKTSIKYGGANVALIDDLNTSYSFLNTIFLNKQSYEKNEIDYKILKHELIHIKQKHSADVLLIELLTSLFWYNPFLYLYKRAIKLNHEFLADEGVVKESNQILEYQRILVNQSGSNYHSFASSFNYLITKKRLLMITKNTSNTSIFFRTIFLAGLSYFIVCSFGKANNNIDKMTMQLENKVSHILLSNNDNIQMEVTDTVPLKTTIQFTPPPQPKKTTNENYVTDTVPSNKTIWFTPPKETTIGKGITSDQLKEYEKIIEKYKDRDGNCNNLAKRITAQEREQLWELFSQMTKEQQAVQQIVVYPNWRIPIERKIIPDNDEFESWKNPKMYGIWIDGKKIENSELNKFKNTDFIYKIVSILFPNAKDYGKYSYHVSLYTENGYDAFIKNIKTSKLAIYEKKRSQGEERLYELEE